MLDIEEVFYANIVYEDGNLMTLGDYPTYQGAAESALDEANARRVLKFTIDKVFKVVY